MGHVLTALAIVQQWREENTVNSLVPSSAILMLPAPPVFAFQEQPLTFLRLVIALAHCSQECCVKQKPSHVSLVPANTTRSARTQAPTISRVPVVGQDMRESIVKLPRKGIVDLQAISALRLRNASST